MGELVIQYHDFENAKKEIKKFSEQTTTDLDLKRVDDSKGVGEFLGDWFFGRGIGLDHKVTGEELNDLTSQIQTHLHSINNTQIKLIKEFGQVYSALEALDKDYIQAIMVSIKATEETSEGIQKTQEQIKKIVENQRKTLEELKKFKQKLDGYAHLGDIDKMWESLATAHSLLKNIGSTVEVLQKGASKHQEEINKILACVEKVSSLEHLMDVDKLWSYVEEQKLHLKDIDRVNDEQTGRLQSLSKENDKIVDRVSANEKSIINLNEIINKINGMVHLEDVDSTWDTVKAHSGQITDIEKQNESIVTSVQKNKEDVEAKITEANNAIASLTQKIKYAYLIAGGAAGLAIIELILLLV